MELNDFFVLFPFLEQMELLSASISRLFTCLLILELEDIVRKMPRVRVQGKVKRKATANTRRIRQAARRRTRHQHVGDTTFRYSTDSSDEGTSTSTPSKRPRLSRPPGSPADSGTSAEPSSSDSDPAPLSPRHGPHRDPYLNSTASTNLSSAPEIRPLTSSFVHSAPELNCSLTSAGDPSDDPLHPGDVAVNQDSGNPEVSGPDPWSTVSTEIMFLNPGPSTPPWTPPSLDDDLPPTDDDHENQENIPPPVDVDEEYADEVAAQYLDETPRSAAFSADPPSESDISQHVQWGSNQTAPTSGIGTQSQSGPQQQTTPIDTEMGLTLSFEGDSTLYEEDPKTSETSGIIPIETDRARFNMFDSPVFRSDSQSAANQGREVEGEPSQAAVRQQPVDTCKDMFADSEEPGPSGAPGGPEDPDDPDDSGGDPDDPEVPDDPGDPHDGTNGSGSGGQDINGGSAFVYDGISPLVTLTRDICQPFVLKQVSHKMSSMGAADFVDTVEKLWDKLALYRSLKGKLPTFQTMKLKAHLTIPVPKLEILLKNLDTGKETLLEGLESYPQKEYPTSDWEKVYEITSFSVIMKLLVN